MSETLKAFVSCIRRYVGADDADYFLVIQKGARTETRSLKSKIMINVGEFGTATMGKDAIESFDAVQDEKEKGLLYKKVEECAGRIVQKKVHRTGVEKLDAITDRLWSHLSDAMLVFVRKVAVAAPIVIRFHNDIDGSSGAYALYKSLVDAQKRNKEIDYEANIVWRMHGSVSYSREDATADIMACNNYECTEKPLLVIIDFGTAEESNPGLELVRERFDIIWLDHHPVLEKFAGRGLAHYVNPWNFGGDSNYTAGFLACVFAQTLSEIDTKNMEGASFIGDYSEYAKPDQESRRLAALLDLLTSDTRMASGSKGVLNPKEIDSVLNDKKRSEELIAYAENRVAEMLDIAVKSVKIYKAKETNIYVADFESIRGNEDERYPLPGRFASRLLGRIEELNRVPCILLLHFGHFVSLRMSKKLNERVNLLQALEDVRKDYSQYVDSAGGHSNAASIKLKTDEMKKEVIKSAVDRLKDALEA